MCEDVAKRLLRRFEEQLDAHHKTFEIWKNPTDAMLYALMASYDSMLLPYSLSAGKLSPGVTLAFKTLDDSLSYCLRWLFEKRPIDLATTSDDNVIEAAGELLTFGTSYADIADMHMMYGRGVCDAVVDQSEKRITFKTRESDNRREIDGYLQTYAFQSKVGEQNKERTLRLARECISALAEIDIDYEGGRIAIKDISQLKSAKIQRMVEEEPRPEILPIEEAADFAGFSFGDYKRFWIALSNWGNSLLLLYLRSVAAGMEQRTCMPTQLICENDFISQVRELSDLSEDTIARILDRLTYDWENDKAEILLQPFIHLNNKILWSPLIIRKSRYQRNILKLMARTPELKEVADNLIGARERKFLNLIGARLSHRYGYQFKLNTDVSNQINKQGEIDLLAYQPKAPTEVLIVEAKTILAVDETNEIADATKKLIDAQQQIRQAMAILRSLNITRKKELFKFVNWDKVSEYYPLVVTPDSNPNTLYDDNIVPHISYASLLTFGTRRAFVRPSRIWVWSREKKWVREETPTKQECKYKDIKVGEVTYSLPYVTINEQVESPN